MTTAFIKKGGAYGLGTTAGAKIKAGGQYVPATDVKVKVGGVYQSSVQPPVNLTLPAVTGIPQSSNTLTCNPGTWGGADSIAFRWYKDNLPILDATGSMLTLNPTHIGSVIFCGVTAANQAGAATEVSNSVTIIP